MAVRFVLHSMVFSAIWALALSLSLTCRRPQWRSCSREQEVKPSDTDALTIFRHGANVHGILVVN
jgi:hypothetical protein